MVFGVLDDRPDVLLGDIEAARQARPKASVAAAEETTNSAIETADAKIDSPVKSIPDFAPTTPTQTITELAPTGPSALQLYNQGMNLLGRGDRAGTHARFWPCINRASGSIRFASSDCTIISASWRQESRKIQLAANQVNEGDLNATGPALATEPSLLDDTHREQSAKFDRLRPKR